MTNDKKIEQEVIKTVAECLKIDTDKITIESNFIDDLGADSLDQVELIMELENKFNVEIPDEVAEKIQKISDAIRYIEENSKLKV
jgi:acyl carrier protein